MERVFAALYPLRSEAVYQHRDDVLRDIETGSALDYDLAQCRADCDEPPPVGPDVPHTFSAPPQTGYPAYFFARAARTGADGVPANEIVVFSRASEKEPWLIALNNAYGETLPVFEDEHAGFAKPVPKVPGPAPVSLPAAWAAFLQHWYENGTAPAGHSFLLADYVQERLMGIAQQPAKQAARGEQEARRYTADASTFAAAAASGRAEVCGSVRLEQRITPAEGKDAVLQSRSKREFGSALTPGRYREVVIRSIEQDCFLIPGDGKALPTFTPTVDTSITGTPI